jgi:hypothetical protein
MRRKAAQVDDDDIRLKFTDAFTSTSPVLRLILHLPSQCYERLSDLGSFQFVPVD